MQGGTRGRCSSAQSRGAGVLSTLYGPHPTGSTHGCRKVSQGGLSAPPPAILTLVLPGTEQEAAPGKGGDTEAADGELGKEQGAGTPELPSPCHGVSQTPLGWGHGTCPSAHIHPSTQSFGSAFLWARSRDSGGYGGAQLCAGVRMGHEIPGNVSRPLLLETELVWGQPQESGGAVTVWGARSALGQC